MSGLKSASIQAATFAWAFLLIRALVGIVSAVVGSEATEPWWRRRSFWIPSLTYLGTPIVHYAHTQAFRPHLIEAALATIIVWLSLPWFGPVPLFPSSASALQGEPNSDDVQAWALDWLSLSS